MKHVLLAAACTALVCSSSIVEAQSFSTMREGEYEVSLDALRASAARDFAGFGQLDDNVLSLADGLPERTSIQACRSEAEVLVAVRDVFPRYSLVEFSVSKQFPRNGINFRRSTEEGTNLDLVTFYYTIKKQDMNCVFTFGAFARSSVAKT